MSRPHRREMSMVERRQLWFSQPLGDRQDRCVDKPDLVIQILRLQLPHSPVIAMLEMFDPEGTRDDIVEEREEVLDFQLDPAPVVQFDNDRRGDDPRLSGPFDHLPASLVVGIRAIDRREQGTSVD